MSKQACKKCEEVECECPEWIFTLADLIMCMMGLFVILWVMKPGQQIDKKGGGSEELNKIIAEIRQAFGYQPDPSSTDPIDVYLLVEKLKQSGKSNGPGEKGKARVEARGAEGTDPEVTTIRLGKQATVGGRVLFERGQTRLTQEAVEILDQIVLQIRGHRNIVMVKGHTSQDDLPDTATAEQKMDLSLRRAQLVADYLTSKGVSPDILRVQGCSTFEPVRQRAYTPERQAMNRRVEVEATSTLVEDLQDQPRQTPTTITTPPPGPPTTGTDTPVSPPKQ